MFSRKTKDIWKNECIERSCVTNFWKFFAQREPHLAFPMRCYSDMVIPMFWASSFPKTLVAWASPSHNTLAIWVNFLDINVE